MQFKSRHLLLLLICLLFSPVVVQAQANPLCWQKTQCTKHRNESHLQSGTLSTSELEEGFITNNSQTIAACGKVDGNDRPLGFCLPVSQTETKIAFGGRKKFAHIGEFIQVIYQYGIITAGILSVLMIIAAGFIWTTSGGNAERIGSAKKKIGGALMGLLLASLSYMLLNTLNPALVNIRLPQIWMVNEIGLAPSWCPDVKDGKKVTFINKTDANSQQRTKAKTKLGTNPKFDTDPQKADCGGEYMVEGTGGLSCHGRSCEGSSAGHMCLNFDVVSGERIKKYHCVPSNLVLSMRLSGLFTTLLSSFDVVKAILETNENVWLDIPPPYSDNKTVDHPELWPVCEGSTGLVRGAQQTIQWSAIKIQPASGGAKLINEEVYDYHLTFPRLDLSDDKWCTKPQKLKGLFVMIEIKEAGDWTDPDVWIGQAPPKDKNHNSAVVGTWLQPDELGTRMKFTDYIPVEHLRRGVVLDVSVNDKVFQTVETYTGDKRTNRMPAKEGDNLIPKCWKTKDKKVLEDCPGAKAKPPAHTGTLQAGPPLSQKIGCFIAGTPVETHLGPIPIEQLNPKTHRIYTNNLETHTTSYQPFKSVLQYNVDGYYLVNEGLLEVTGSHPIYTKLKNGDIGWGRIDPNEVHSEKANLTDVWAPLDIEIGDFVLNETDVWIQITNIERVNKPATVYNLEYVAGGNTFYANNILVHNAK